MFTELEYILMLACAVLLWRNAAVHGYARREYYRAEAYAGHLIAIGKGLGTVVPGDDGTWKFKEKEAP